MTSGCVKVYLSGFVRSFVSSTIAYLTSEEVSLDSGFGTESICALNYLDCTTAV